MITHGKKILLLESHLLDMKKVLLMSTYTLSNHVCDCESTLHLSPGYSFPENMDFFYNDRFEMVFGGTFDPKPRNKLLAIEQGLPNPMIVVAEYMDTFGGGFKWGLAIPAAGYYGKSNFHV